MLEDIDGLAWVYLTFKITLYHPNGAIKLIQTFINRRKEGELVKYLLGGGVVKENYKCGVLNGKKLVYRGGVLIRKENYVDDRRHGKYISYDNNGQMERKCWYHRGSRHGRCLSYRNGKLYEEFRYYYNNIIGECKLYNNDGKIKISESYDIYGLKHGMNYGKLYNHGALV